MTFIMHFNLDVDIDKGSKKNYLPRESSVEDPIISFLPQCPGTGGKVNTDYKGSRNNVDVMRSLTQKTESWVQVWALLLTSSVAFLFFFFK